MERSQKGHQTKEVEQTVEDAAHEGHHTPPSAGPHASGPRVIVVGSEIDVFQHGSPVHERILAYTDCFSTTDIIVMCGKGFQKEEARPYVWLHPTNSRSRLWRVLDAIRIGRHVPRADVVTVQDPFETAFAGLFIAKKVGARLHVQVHTDPFAFSYFTHSIINLIRVHLALYILRRADGIRVVSDHVRRSIEAHLRPKHPIAVLPIFVDVDRIRQSRAPQEFADRFTKFKTRVLVVARLEPEKNVELAIHSFAEGAPSDSCLIIVGSGSEREKLEQLAKESSASDRILFEGKQEAIPYYKIADLVLVPSHYEGYGLVIIEALAAGKPVLATDIGIAREMGAIIASPEEFPAAILKWFESGPRTARLSHYPYHDFDEYRHAYCADIAVCARL